MVGFEGKLDYHDQPRSIKTKQDQPRSNQGQLNENQRSAPIALLETGISLKQESSTKSTQPFF